MQLQESRLPVVCKVPCVHLLRFVLRVGAGHFKLRKGTVHDTYTQATLGTGGRLLLPDKDFPMRPFIGSLYK